MKYFTADLHLGHERILDADFSARPFRTIKEHDDHIIAQINETVDSKDELFILGDFCWNNSYRKPGHFRNRIKCRTVHLIRGNHDQPVIEKQFSTVEDVRMIKIGRDTTDRSKPPVTLQAFLSHYAHAYWPSSHYGAFHLYGHNHDTREETLDQMFPGRRAMDVGVDTAKRLLGEFKPFSDMKIIMRFIGRPGHDPVEWYKERRRQGRHRGPE